jgi:protein SCO1/2
MNNGVKVVLSVLVIFSVGVWFGYQELKPVRTLKVYKPSDVNPTLVDSSLQRNHHAHKIANFELINQQGDTITNLQFENSIYVADFFFTTCRSICPKMTKQMARVQEAFLANADVKLLSHSVTPEIDSVAVLANYANEFGALANKWHLVTGPKPHIYELARKSYFAVTDVGNGDKLDFIHTENFVLVDKNKQIRGFYDGTSTEEVDQLIADIQLLIDQEKKGA